MIRIPESLDESGHRLECTIPEPIIETEKAGDGSFKLIARYDASGMYDFARRAAKEMCAKFDAALIRQLLEFNGYIRCQDCRHFKAELTEHCDLHRHLCKPSDYCAWADSKED